MMPKATIFHCICVRLSPITTPASEFMTQAYHHAGEKTLPPDTPVDECVRGESDAAGLFRRHDDYLVMNPGRIQIYILSLKLQRAGKQDIFGIVLIVSLIIIVGLIGVAYA